MITIKSLRGGIVIAGIDATGNFLKHNFKRSNEKHKFLKVDAEVLKQAEDLSWIVFSGKEENLPSQKIVEKSQHSKIEKSNMVSNTLDESIAAREALALAKMRIIGLPTATENEKSAKEVAIKELPSLNETAKAAGDAYQKATEALANSA